MERKKLSFYLVGSIVSIVAFLAVIELVTRTVSWSTGKGFTLALHELDPTDQGIIDIYQWHPFTGFIFRPNTVFSGSHPNQPGEARIRIDSHGFLALDNDLKVEKLPNEIRVATVGASTTASVNLEFEQNWPGRLGRLIQKSFPDKTIRVINAGVPGYDTSQSIGNLALRVMPFKPDVVIIYHAYNDMKAVHPGVEFKPDYSHIHSRPYGQHEKPFFLLTWLNRSMFYVRIRNNYREMKSLEAKNQRIKNDNRLSTIPVDAENAFDQHIRAMIGIARAGGAKVVLSSFATLHDPSRFSSDDLSAYSPLQKSELGSLMHFTPGLTVEGIFNGFNRYNNRLHKIAVEEKTGWVDNAKLIPHKDEFFVDRVHFSKAGAAAMADNFHPVVLRELKK